MLLSMLLGRPIVQTMNLNRDMHDVLAIEAVCDGPRWGEDDFRDAFRRGAQSFIVSEQGKLIGFFLLSPGPPAVIEHYRGPLLRKHILDWVAGVWHAQYNPAVLVPEYALSLQLALKEAHYRAEAVERARFPGGEAAYRFVPSSRAGAVAGGTSAGPNVVAVCPERCADRRDDPGAD